MQHGLTLKHELGGAKATAQVESLEWCNAVTFKNWEFNMI